MYVKEAGKWCEARVAGREGSGSGHALGAMSVQGAVSGIRLTESGASQVLELQLTVNGNVSWRKLGAFGALHATLLSKGVEIEALQPVGEMQERIISAKSEGSLKQVRHTRTHAHTRTHTPCRLAMPPRHACNSRDGRSSCAAGGGAALR